MKAGFKKSLTALFFSAVIATSLSPSLKAAESSPAYPILNLDTYIRELGLNRFYSRAGEARRPIRIAILDNGFAGYEREIGKSLPASTQLHPGPIAPDPSMPEDRHGLVMAQILNGLMTDRGRLYSFAPELHLYPTYGYSNFKAAIDDVIARQVDIILYAQVWEYGGNGDGKGFINAQVDRAVGAGITWINAAGDFGDTTYLTSIRDGADGWVALPGPNQSVELRCEQNPKGSCSLRLVLSWNDFKNDTQLGTDKDLDLILTDDTLNIVQTSTLTQSPTASDQPGVSLYPREILTAQLTPGLYYIRVKNRSHNFDPLKDMLRLTASGDFISMPRHTSGETILNPADNPGVITVGERNTQKSSESRQTRKPDLLAPSLIEISSTTPGGKTERYKGTSSASAIVAAGFGILKALRPEATRDQLLTSYRKEMQSSGIGNGGGIPGRGLPLDMLGFRFTGSGCFVPIDLRGAVVPYYIQNALQYGGTLVQTTAGWKIFYGYDPIALMPGIRRIQPNDILVITPQGGTFYPRNMLYRLPPNYIEVLQTPLGQSICQVD